MRKSLWKYPDFSWKMSVFATLQHFILDHADFFVINDFFYKINDSNWRRHTLRIHRYSVNNLEMKRRTEKYLRLKLHELPLAIQCDLEFAHDLDRPSQVASLLPHSLLQILILRSKGITSCSCNFYIFFSYLDHKLVIRSSTCWVWLIDKIWVKLKNWKEQEVAHFKMLELTFLLVSQILRTKIGL